MVMGRFLQSLREFYFPPSTYFLLLLLPTHISNASQPLLISASFFSDHFHVPQPRLDHEYYTQHSRVVSSCSFSIPLLPSPLSLSEPNLNLTKPQLRL